MSGFLAQAASDIFGYSGVFASDDERGNQDNFQWSVPFHQVASFADGLLWPNSRGLSANASFLFGNDQFNAAPRWQAPVEDGGSIAMKKIIGTTRDANGNPLGSCVVRGFLTTTNQFVRQMTSDGAGYYEFCSENSGVSHYLVAYLVGSPDVEGTTVNTLQPV